MIVVDSLGESLVVNTPEEGCEICNGEGTYVVEKFGGPVRFDCETCTDVLDREELLFQQTIERFRRRVRQ